MRSDGPRLLGSAVRIADQGSDSIAVVSATPAPQLDQDDGRPGDRHRGGDGPGKLRGVVRPAADELFEDPDGWFEEEGEIAISASDIEVLQEQATG